jgi:superfamily I DNA/RNA helicase
MAFITTPYHTAISDYLHETDGNLIVNASPGSGKTTTSIRIIITSLIKELARDARTVIGAYIAFNKKNADEAAAKISDPRVKASTVHAFMLGCLRGKAKVETDQEPNSRNGWRKSIGKTMRITESLMPDEDGHTGARRAQVCKLVDLAKSQAMGLPGYADISDRPAWEKIIATYSNNNNNDDDDFDIIEWAQVVMRATLRDKEHADFIDMIYMPLFLGLPLPDVKFVVYDEGQDCTPLMLEMLIRLSNLGVRIVLVGDTNQGINLFMGARPGALDFAREKLNASSLPLPVSYRAPKLIAEAANGIFPNSIIAADGAAEGSITTTTYAEFLDSAVPGLSRNDGVIARAHKYLIPLALQLMKGGREFSYKGIAETVDLMTKMLYHNNKGTLTDIRRGILEYQDAMEDRYTSSSGKMPAWLVRKREITDCLGIVLASVESDGGDIETVKKYLKTLSSAERCFSGPTLATIHASKGGEWRNVYIVGPPRSPLATTEDEIKAEACVEYVAITRALENLICVTV